MAGNRIIEIRGLEVSAHIWVPDEERAQAQRLLIDLRFAAADQPPDLGEDINRTIDYHSVTLRVVAIARERPRKLIETLADELVAALLSEFAIRWIEITVRKFILPRTEWVSVTTCREVNGNGAGRSESQN